MATHMVKYGSSDNIKTFEHWCDTYADLATIDPSQINLGSVAVVIEGQSGGLEIYVAKSNKSWKLVTTSSGSTTDENNLNVTIKYHTSEGGNDTPYYYLDKDIEEIALYFDTEGKTITVINDTEEEQFDNCEVTAVNPPTRSIVMHYGVDITNKTSNEVYTFAGGDSYDDPLIYRPNK